MPKNIPPLSAVAEAKKDEKAKGKIASALTALGAALGLNVNADTKPGAKMTKKTLTTKRVEMEESDDSEAEEEESAEEEEESLPMSTEKSSGAASSEPADSKEEEEEEASDAAEEEEEARGGKKMEEEEERAVARGWKAAIAAYAKATKGFDAYGVHGPKGLLRAAQKATGAKGERAAISALHGLRGKAAKADAEVIQRIAKVEQKTAKIAADSRADRIEAIVKDAKADGRASSKSLREQLRAYGMQNGSKALRALVETLPQVRTKPALGSTDATGNVVGAPAADFQAKMMEASTAGMTPEQKKEWLALYEATAKKNGLIKNERDLA